MAYAATAIGPSKPAYRDRTTDARAKEPHTAQAMRGEPNPCIADQANASGSPQGAMTTSDSHARGSNGKPNPRTTVVAAMPMGSHNSATSQKSRRGNLLGPGSGSAFTILFMADPIIQMLEF